MSRGHGVAEQDADTLSIDGTSASESIADPALVPTPLSRQIDIDDQAARDDVKVELDGFALDESHFGELVHVAVSGDGRDRH